MAQQTLTQMRDLFEQEASLADKQALLQRVYDSGESMLFEGALNWTIELPEDDRIAEGDAESMDDAIQAILASLRLFEEHYGTETPVRLAFQAFDVQQQDTQS